METVKNFYLIPILSLLLIFTGCEDENWAEIDSLSADGDEFYTNQLVKLWMAVNSNSLYEITYEWGCEGGTLVQPQGLDEMTWRAPKEPGVYKVFCKVTTGGHSEIRYKDMNVSSFFFEKFQKSGYSFVGQSSTKLSLKTETLGGKSNGYLEAYVSSTTSSNRYVYYNFSNPELKTPFSFMSKVGWLSNFPTDTVIVKTSAYPHQMSFRLTLGRDPDKADVKYIDELHLSWFPVRGPEGYPVDPGTSQAFNGIITFQENNMGSRTLHNINFFSDRLAFAKNDRKNVAVNIDASYLISVYVDGVKVAETAALQEWRQANNAQDDVHINEWRYILPNGNGGNNPPKFFFDDAYAKNDGSLLTGN